MCWFALNLVLYSEWAKEEMTKEALIKDFEPLASYGEINEFIEDLYEQGYCVLSPDERKKVDGIIVLAEVHGMNPFKPKGEECNKSD